MQPRGVDHAADDVAHVVLGARVGGDVVQAGGVLGRLLDRVRRDARRARSLERVDDGAHDLQGMVVVVGQVVDDAGRAGVDVAATEVLGADLLAGGRLHQRRAAEEDRALVLDDHRLVAHRGHVGAARRARAHHGGHLADARGRHLRLVEEDAAEVVAVGEHLVLHRQERATGVDEVDAVQVVLLGDRLGSQVLLDRERVVRAALHRGVVGDDHAVAAGDLPDAGDDAGARHGVHVVSEGAPVHPEGGQRRDLEERRARVEHVVDPVAGQQLAPLHVTLAGLDRAALADDGEPLAELGDQFFHAIRLASEVNVR